ncbi:hypothetical protein G6F43_005028 [Rhizopus delemar]|nr:hypothetical protein G6F43_005028 [Rhizopus delemar]
MHFIKHSIKQEDQGLSLQGHSLLPQIQESYMQIPVREDLVMLVDSPYYSSPVYLSNFINQIFNNHDQNTIVADNYAIKCNEPEHVSLLGSSNSISLIDAHGFPLCFNQSNEVEDMSDRCSFHEALQQDNKSKLSGNSISNQIEAQIENKKTIYKDIRTEKYKKRNTSYDYKTTAYLQSVFFDVYSKQPKLTKQQRMVVQKRTGLPSRNITYWFSNHKRRFQKSLHSFQKVTKSSNRSVLTYNDFIKWHKMYGSPNNITRGEST